MLGKRTASGRDGDFESDERESTVKAYIKSKAIRSSDAGL